MVRMELGEVKSQTAAIKKVAEEVKQAGQKLGQAATGVSLNPGLSGKAFQSIGQYLGQVYPALAKALDMMAEDIATANQNYVDGYTSEVGSKSLDSDELTQQIQQTQTIIDNHQANKEMMEQIKRSMPPETKALMMHAFDGLIQSYQKSIDRNEKKKAKLQKKLEKLVAFDAKSPSYFQDLATSTSLVNQGLQALGVSGDGQITAGNWNGNGFSGYNTEWIKKTNQVSEERAQRKKQAAEAAILHELKDYKVYAIPYLKNPNDPNSATIMWVLEKDGKGVVTKDTVKLYDYLEGSNGKGFEYQLKGFDWLDKKTRQGWEKGYNYLDGSSYGAFSGVVQVSYKVQQVDEYLKKSGLYDVAMMAGLTYGLTKVTSSGAKTGAGKKASGASNLKVPKATELSMTETVSNHSVDIIKKGVNAGELSRPYVNSKGTDLLVQEIMDSRTPIKDASLPNGLRWDVPGSFNGSGQGTWELVVDLDTNKIVHFNFTK